MIRFKLFTAFLALSLFCACGGTELKNEEGVGSREEQSTVTDDPVENLKSNAIQHDDPLGQAKWGLGALQSAYNESSASVDVLGEVKVLLDENFMLAIQNDLDGDVYEQRVNLADLNSDLKSFEWIVNNNENPYPGVKIPVLEGASGVENLEDGILKGTENHLEIILADRKMVQRSISGLMNSIRAARGEALDK